MVGRMDTFGLSDIGLVRDCNEDQFLIADLKSLLSFIRPVCPTTMKHISSVALRRNYCLWRMESVADQLVIVQVAWRCRELCSTC